MKWILIGFIVIGFGFWQGGAIIYNELTYENKREMFVELPANLTILSKEVGETWKVWYLQKFRHEGEIRSQGTEVPAGIKLKVTSLNSGKEVAIEGASATLTVGNTYAARGIFSFDCPRVGKFDVQLEGPAGTFVEVGPSRMLEIFNNVLLAILFIVGGLMVGLIFLVVGAVSISKNADKPKDPFKKYEREKL